ncbi:MAG: hypothetical protein KC983_00025 [Phycisphaerales bacterium]|nr:hypothetical protein [Phycisphaerales bacterium]
MHATEISLLLAQAVQTGPQSGSIAAGSGVAAVGLIGGILFALLMYAVLIGLCTALFVGLGGVPREHRAMEPALVFLLLIPLFNIIWNFFVLTRIPASYERAFRAYGRTHPGDCGKGVGLAAAICYCGVFISCIPFLACIGWIPMVAAFVLMIIFLVKLFTMKGELARLVAAGAPAEPYQASGIPPADS